MKRIFLACCIIATSYTVTMAQSAQTSTTNTVDKAAFIAKINQLNTFLSAGDSISAAPVFKDLKVMMGKQLGTCKEGIGVAATQDEKTRILNKLRDEQTYYSHVMIASHQGIIANRATINTNLQSFSQSL